MQPATSADRDRNHTPKASRFQPCLFIVDDEPTVRDVVARLAAPLGFEVQVFENGHAALAELSRRSPDGALVDLQMPSIGGLSVLREFKRLAPVCEVILMTGYATIDTAVEAIKLGASDYLTKPLEFARLRELLLGIHQEAVRRAEVNLLEQDLLERFRFQGMIGRGPAMRELFSLIRRIAPHLTTGLVTGETGTGKELVARALHALGSRRSGPFVPVNCSAIVEGPLESELFGHAGNGLRGPAGSEPGVFERAHGGTIFLDEISALTPVVQARLLRVLEDGELSRLGSADRLRVDVRVIASTNQVLEREVQRGQFRPDVYYRLNGVRLDVPPLRQRREDIPLLVRAFVEDFARQFQKRLHGVTARAEHHLMEHAWPGNVRELRNVLERASMLAQGEFIDDRDLELRVLVGTGKAAAATVRPIADLERLEILKALEETGGNKKQAASRLGISRRALYRRLDKFGLGRHDAFDDAADRSDGGSDEPTGVGHVARS
jgi:DNA-binding NtrC family response regulator